MMPLSRINTDEKVKAENIKEITDFRNKPLTEK
jgi:hypothetical protein